MWENASSKSSIETRETFKDVNLVSFLLTLDRYLLAKRYHIFNQTFFYFPANIYLFKVDKKH